jgi:hypothetical protein
MEGKFGPTAIGFSWDSFQQQANIKKISAFYRYIKKKSARYATALHLQPFKKQGVDREKKK